MKEHHLPCSLVRDLLPSYIDGLTEEETALWIKEHLKECPDCARRYEEMNAPEHLILQTQPEQKEVDFLKSVRRHSRNQILLTAVIVCALLLSAVGAKLFLIGSPLKAGGVSYEADYSQETETLDLHCFLLDSASAFSGWDIQQSDGTVTLTARKVLVSPVHHTGSEELHLSLEQVHTVRLLDQVIWQDGLVIDQTTNDMYAARTPYVGSISNVHALAGTMDLPHAAFTNELQTTAEPYGWTLLFEAPLSPMQQEQMLRAAPLLLALVDNMGVIRWTCPDKENPDSLVETTVSAEEINEHLPELTEQHNRQFDTDWSVMDSLKDYGQSPYTLQQLVQLLES